MFHLTNKTNEIISYSNTTMQLIKIKVILKNDSKLKIELVFISFAY